MIKFNIFTGNFDFVGSNQAASGSIKLDLLAIDPVGATDGDAWVLVKQDPDGGNLIYFHGAMPVTEPAADQFLFSVQTPSGAKRVELT